jgi:hypothetical protein
MYPHKENFGLAGQVYTLLHNRYGFLKEERLGPNMVTNKGEEQTVRCLSNQTGTAFGWIGIGTNSGGEAETNTTLGAEITTGGGVRSVATKTITTVTSANDTANFVCIWTFSASFNVTESGVFNNVAYPSGDMLCRKVFAAIPVQSGDQLTITWRVTAASSGV